MIKERDRQQDIDGIYRDWFKNHKLMDYSDSDDIMTAKWKEDGTGIFQVNVILSKKLRTVFISGDIGEAVYQFGGLTSIFAFRQLGLSYFSEKCVASEYGRRYLKWSGKKCLSFLNDHCEHLDEDDGVVVQEELFEAQRRTSSEHEWREFLNGETGRSLLGDDGYEHSDWGMQPDLRCLGHLIALHEIAEAVLLIEAAKDIPTTETKPKEAFDG